MPKKPCFGNLDIVFPMGEDGLRHVPDNCFKCEEKTPCLKTALHGDSGINVKEEKLEREHKSGHVSFLSRWSRKKALSRAREKTKK